MKKLLSFAVLALVLTAVLTSCADNSPRGVAEKAIKAMKNKDVRGYLDLVYFSPEEQQQKEAYIQMAEEKLKKNPEQANAKSIESYKFVSEEIDEEAGRASVVFEVTYSDDKVSNENIDLKRADDGKWYVVQKK